MTASSDHLIERAAALLQSGVARKADALPVAPSRALPEARLDASVNADPLAIQADAVRPVPAQAGAAPPPRLLRTAPPDVLPTASAKLPGAATLDPQAAAPVAAPVIMLEALEQAGMILARTARTRISEEYRIVVGRVLRAMRAETEGNGLSNVLMVTSARPGEGKSFSALNLAGSIAQHGSDKVLLVDLDAKLRPISAQLGVGDRIGFQDLVVNPALRPEDLILSTAIGNLFVLPVGTRLGEVLDPNSVRPIPPTITRLARRFPKHVIVLDAPPCLSTSDPHTIAPFVGQVVMVVEAERTQRSEVEAAIDLIRVCPTITILLNKVRLTTSHTFGAYDYYGSYT